MPATRCKFKCQSVKHTIYKDKVQQVEVALFPVYSATDSENKKFWEATPNGKLELTLNNPAVFGFFVSDQDYYLDITPVPTPVT